MIHKVGIASEIFDIDYHVILLFIIPNIFFLVEMSFHIINSTCWEYYHKTVVEKVLRTENCNKRPAFKILT